MTDVDIVSALRNYKFAPYLSDPERLVNELHLARSPTLPKPTPTTGELREAIAARMRQQQ